MTFLGGKKYISTDIVSQSKLNYPQNKRTQCGNSNCFDEILLMK